MLALRLAGLALAAPHAPPARARCDDAPGRDRGAALRDHGRADRRASRSSRPGVISAGLGAVPVAPDVPRHRAGQPASTRTSTTATCRRLYVPRRPRPAAALGADRSPRADSAPADIVPGLLASTLARRRGPGRRRGRQRARDADRGRRATGAVRDRRPGGLRAAAAGPGSASCGSGLARAAAAGRRARPRRSADRDRRRGPRASRSCCRPGSPAPASTAT